MHLIELLLPADATYAAKRRALADDLSKTFGGVTAFNRAPAKGLFEQGGTQVKDDIVVFEVMTATLDRAWWSSLRKRLEAEMNQNEIVIRATSIEKL